MSDAIKHECGIAMIALRKPLEFYIEKYGTAFYGLNKLHLLMQKQHNRGQDGAGIACIKKNLKPGVNYIDRIRSVETNPIVDVFNQVYDHIEKKKEDNPKEFNDPEWLKNNVKYSGELLLGHLRYGTFGKNEISAQHPLVRANNWKTRNLAIAGNFNLTNVDELFQRLVDLGQYPTRTSDTVTILEKIGHFLDEENERLYAKYKRAGYSKKQITPLIAENLDLFHVLSEASEAWDGGFVVGGLVGHGDAFLIRDPAGIRPAFYYVDDEVIVAASERPVIQTAFNVKTDQVKELDPGHALLMRHDGSYQIAPYTTPMEKKPCSFERIYFSRGTDSSIYKERKALGAAIIPPVLEAIDNDLENTVFSFIPNTASVAFQGLADGLGVFCDDEQKAMIMAEKVLTPERLDKIFKFRPRFESVAVKDMKLRTFITQDNKRDDLVGHVYDVTYDSIREGKDKLVILDDSIVRGTTLKQSIIRILDRLGPTKIVVVSSAPQIRYPDCYGIDMARMGDFIAFKAAVELIKERKMEDLLDKVYLKCKAQEKLPKDEVINFVREVYDPFTPEEISAKIAQLISSPDVKSEIEVIFQSIENLHLCIPDHGGDWYFTGNYPTPGGNKVVNKAFINYMEGNDQRAY